MHRPPLLTSHPAVPAGPASPGNPPGPPERVPGAAAADHVRLAVTAGEDATAQVRRFVRLFAQQSGVDGERADDLVQAAAELLAVGRHADRVRAVEVEEVPDAIRVVVDVTGPGVPDVPAEAGALLSGLSREWGWYRTPGALQVWCEVTARDAAG